MRKKILSATLVVAIAAIAGYNVYSSQIKSSLSGLALANVEALAYPVENGDGEIMYKCEDKGICEYELGIALPGTKK